MKYLLTAVFIACIQIAVAQDKSQSPWSEKLPKDQLDENGLRTPLPADPGAKTVPHSPFENPKMSLIEQERLSRCTLASREVNRSLGIPIPDFCGGEPLAKFAWFTALVATLALTIKAAWVGIPLVSAVSSTLQRGFFRWPETPLEWINKLAIYIGLADSALMLVR